MSGGEEESGSAWWSSGYDEVDKEIEEQSKPRAPRRWYLPAEHSGVVTFVTDQPLVIREHNMMLDGHWRNWFTCLRENCPLCRAGNDPYVASVWIVVDHGEWTDSDGNEHKDEVRLFVAKARVASRLKRHAQRQEGLRGCRFELYRSERMAANTGDQIELDRKYEEKELKRLKWWPNEFDTMSRADLAELVAPKTPDQLMNIVSRIAQDSDQDEDRNVRF